jgi:predicted protein tyrosine phosphatase
MKVHVYNQIQACALGPTAGTVVISITNPGKPAPLQEGWEALLRIECHGIAYRKKANTLFDKDMAALVIEFSHTHQDKDFVVHCSAGQSRSCAVAMYLQDVFRADVLLYAVEDVYDFNTWIYQLLMQGSTP